jgi:hypothetical protein
MSKFNLLFLLTCLTSAFSLNAQVVSQFTWDDSTLGSEVADTGPNATSISGSAVNDINGVNGTNGLNPGDPKRDIEMVFANDPIFNVDGIDISIDYQRDESVGTFFKRGNGFSFLGAKNLYVNYSVESTNGNVVSVSSGNVFNIPNDNTFRNYRFTYDPISGIGTLYVDGVQVWQNDGPDNHVLVWDNADIIIGHQMDGSGNNRPIYDNYILSNYQQSSLPIELFSFTAEANEMLKAVDLEWITATETNNDFFTLERSVDGENWEAIQTMKGAGNSTVELDYAWRDKSPLNGFSYYRLKQTDFDGAYSYSSIKSVTFDGVSDFKVYPNPVQQGASINVKELDSHYETSELTIYATNGQLMKRILLSENDISITFLNDLKPGIYLVVYNGTQKKLVVN